MGNFSSRVQGQHAEQGISARNAAPLVPGIVYEEILASNKLLRTAKALHHKHKLVVCKIFQHLWDEGSSLFIAIYFSCILTILILSNDMHY